MKEWIREHKMSIFVMVSAIVMLIGLSYAWLQITLRGEKEIKIFAAGTLQLELDDTMTSGIMVENAIPITDEEGKSLEAYTFTLTNTGKIASDYTIYLDDLELPEGKTRMPDNTIKYYLTKEGQDVAIELLSTTGENPNRILDSGLIETGEKYTYTLRMWIDYNAGNEVMGTVFKGQLRIEGVQNQGQNAVSKLLKKVNLETISYDSATEEQQKEMFIVKHEAGEQQGGYTEEELTDYRYMGNNPNNYVKFNNSMWRIVGIFTVEDEQGNKEQHLKIMTSVAIGVMSWDNKGENEWSTSALQQLLNGPYYNHTIGTCPFGGNGAGVPCDYTKLGIQNIAQSMIGNTKWYLGGYVPEMSTVSQQYKNERGNHVYEGRTINWLGKVGLIYLSDFGYASGRIACFSTSFENYNQDCNNTNWIYRNASLWTITPHSRTNNSVLYFYKNASGINTTNTKVGLHPVVYLKSDVLISSGIGSSTNPYILKYEV